MTYPNATHITKDFTWAEFRVNPFTMKSDDKTRLINHCRNVLQPTRDHYNRPVTVTPEGGYRSFEEQTVLWEKDLREHGGKPSGKVARPGSSRHQYGDASDIFIRGVSNADLAAYLATNPHVGGIGIYPWGVHVDSRPIGSPGRPGKAIARW